MGVCSCAAFTELNHYVAYNDNVYHWNVSETVITKPTYTVYNIYLTSQRWLTKGEVENGGYIWRHWLQVCVPKDMLPGADMAFLYINGGSNKDFNEPPGDIDTIVSSFAVSTGTIGASLNQIPNEPLTFVGAEVQSSRSEDALIAYTWSHFINNTLEYDWLARMPMTKASIRAMDAMQEFVATLDDIPAIERFAVGGASKRGWTTWMVGAMEDPRVVGIVPIVAPVANLVPQINEMWQSYGEWSFALQDYLDMNLMGWLNLPRFTEMLDIIDPLSYPQAMANVPKYVVNACGDEFFMPDAAQYYWDQLEGKKYLYLVPNAEHSLAGHALDVVGSAEQFYLAYYYNNATVLPDYSWEISEDGSTITVTTQQTDFLVGAKVYYSQNNTARDWRLITCSDASPSCVNLALFAHEDLEPISDGVFEYTLDMPPEGMYSAFMIELNYNFDWPSLNGAARKDFHVTSNLSILPRNEYPYPPCGTDVCHCGYDCATNYYNQ